MDIFAKLQFLKDFNGSKRDTTGLDVASIKKFASLDADLVRAIESAYEVHKVLQDHYGEVLRLAEAEQVKVLHEGFLNFYDAGVVNPYVPLSAYGPWIITTCGAVVHDSGGYGMLGFGHNPEAITSALSGPQVMANIMTASFSQRRFMEKLGNEIGHCRKKDRHPYAQYVCMNSGSEAMTVAMRISDLNAKQMTDPGARHQGKQIRIVSNTGSFHGRTDRPAQASHSSHKKYAELASFRGFNRLWTITPNSMEDLLAVYKRAEAENVFIEAVLLEPVMGEGNPGVALTPELYALARELTRKHGSLLIIDSIQAGLRTYGHLSIVDYPGFEELPAPDMESYSKALNAGQYPLSVLALSKRASSIHKPGIYGNTMTTNPRALDVGAAVLDMITDDIRTNIQERGKEFVAKLKALATELKGAITDVQGTGLLFAASLDEKQFLACGFGSTEEYLRKRGIGVIHGGKNALRFTPHFRISSAEIDLVIHHIRDALVNGPRI